MYSEKFLCEFKFILANFFERAMSIKKRVDFARGEIDILLFKF